MGISAADSEMLKKKVIGVEKLLRVNQRAAVGRGAGLMNHGR